MALAAVFLLTAKEPERGAVEVAAPRPAPESFWTAVRFLGGSRAYLLFLVGATFMGANVYAAAIWTPTFLSRVHDMNLAEIAGTTGQIRGWFGVAGVLAGGILADRLGQLDERWRVRIPAIACVLLGPAEALFLFSDPTLLWMSGYALTSFLTLLHQPPIFAAALSIASPRMRAVATSLLILCASLLGQVAGPFVVGYLNDKLHPTLGDAAIRYSLLVMAATAIAAGLAFWTSARFIRGDVRRAAER
jgi:MFS family permease